MDEKQSRGKTLGKYLAITLLAYLMMGFFALVTVSVKPLDPLSSAIKNFSFTDIYYEVLNESSVKDTSNLVTLVDMTNLYRRGELAKVMDDIMSCKPKVMGVDMVFESEKEDFAGNDSLITVAAQYDNIVFSHKLLDSSGDPKIGFTKEIHSFFNQFVPIKEGFCNMPRGGHYDSMKRVVPLRYRSNGEEKPSLVAHTVSVYTGKEIWKEGKESIDINFSPMEFRVLSPDEVLQHPEWIEGHIVLFGAMYDENDSHWTPAGKIAGVKLLAFAAQTLVDQKEVYHLPFLLQLLVSILLTLFIYSMQKYFKLKTSKSNRLFVRFIVGSSYVLNIITFLLTSVLLGACFFIFALTQVSVNISWALASLAFTSTSANMYGALSDYVEARINKRKG